MNNVYSKFDLKLIYHFSTRIDMELLGLHRYYIALNQFIKSYPHDREKPLWKFFTHD